jgi:hypothetical protein
MEFVLAFSIIDFKGLQACNRYVRRKSSMRVDSRRITIASAPQPEACGPVLAARRTTAHDCEPWRDSLTGTNNAQLLNSIQPVSPADIPPSIPAAAPSAQPPVLFQDITGSIRQTARPWQPVVPTCLGLVSSSWRRNQ